MPTNEGASSASESRSQTARSCRTKVISVKPQEWIYKGDNEFGWEDIKKGKWLYIFKDTSSDRPLHECVTELQSTGGGGFDQVTWSSASDWKPRKKRQTTSAERVVIGKEKGTELYLCISRVQLPYRRIQELVSGTGVALSSRCEQLSDLIEGDDLRGEYLKVRLKQDGSGSQPDSSSEGVTTIELVDSVERLEAENDRYMASVAEYYKKVVEVRGERKKVRLAILAKRVAEKYTGSTDDYSNPYHLDMLKYVDLQEYIDDTVEMVSVLQAVKEKRWMSEDDWGKEKWIESPKFRETLNDYMFDMHDVDLECKGLHLAAISLAGAIFSRNGREYLNSVVSGQANLAAWFEEYFFEKENPGFFFENASEEDIAVVIMNLGTALVSSGNPSKARELAVQTVDGWLSQSIGAIEDGRIDSARYVGRTGFPQRLPKDEYYRTLKDAAAIGEETVGVVDEWANAAAEADSADLKQRLNWAKGTSTHPLLLALVVLNLSLGIADVLGGQGDKPPEKLVMGGIGIASGGLDALSMTVGLLGDTAAAAGSLSITFAVFASMLTFVGGVTGSIIHAMEGRYGKAIGWGLIGVGGFIGIIYGAGAASLGAGIVAGLLVLTGVGIVMYFTDDPYEEWFRKSPWGTARSGYPDVESATRELLNLIGKPKVSTKMNAHSEVELTIKTPFFFGDQTKIRVNPFSVKKRITEGGPAPGYRYETFVETKFLSRDIQDNLTSTGDGAIVNVSVPYSGPDPAEVNIMEDIVSYCGVKIKYIKECYPENWDDVNAYNYNMPLG